MANRCPRLRGSVSVPPGMVDGGDIDEPDWRNDGNEQGLEIGKCSCGEGYAQRPEGPADEQTYRSDHDEKPAGLGGTGVIAGPTLILPETCRS